MMPIQALVVAPYPGLAKMISDMSGELPDFEITVGQADLSEALVLMDEWKNKHFDVIVSRGGTAELLREQADIPVIDIPVTGYDAMRMLLLWKDAAARIEMVGYPNVIRPFQAVSELIGIPVSCSLLGREEDAEHVLGNLKARGVQVVAGDTITVKKAAEHGLQGVLITSGREAVLEAFEQARQTYSALRRWKEAARFQIQLLDRTGEGFLVLDELGNIRWTNRAFRERFAGVEEATSVSELHRFPLLEQALRLQMKQGADGALPFPLTDAGEQIRVEFGKLQSQAEPQREWRCIIVRPLAGLAKENPRMILHESADGVPPVYSPVTVDEIAQAAAWTEHGPVAVCGERGVGKRELAQAVQYLIAAGSAAAAQAGCLMELVVNGADQESASLLAAWVQDLEPEQVLLLRGMEDMQPAACKKLAAALAACKGRVLCSFEQPAKWREESPLHKLFGRRMMRIAPLREKPELLDLLLRGYLTAYNERYGKQIAGIRPPVMQQLRQYGWPGNAEELRLTLDLFVRETNGYYIEDQVLPLLGTALLPASGTAGWLDLSKPLAEIERDIIEYVLVEEQMNQSKAAQRLGINRTTLWRKLKLPENES
ncbi:PrpR N-terminal domain-containing protein [Paenibacillus thalictri]|nr:PrpR N-terminal domain-containing protein [Paenibacillus thalictri]